MMGMSNRCDYMTMYTRTPRAVLGDGQGDRRWRGYENNEIVKGRIHMIAFFLWSFLCGWALCGSPPEMDFVQIGGDDGGEPSRICPSRSKVSNLFPETIHPENGGSAVLNSAPFTEVTSKGPIVPKLECSVSVVVGTPRRRTLAC